jgi:hypothetical protein
MSENKRVLRIRVTEGNKQKVNITVPLGLARLALIGGIAGQISKRHGIDLDEVLRGIEESPDGKMVDVIDEKSGDHVQIYVETLGTADADTTNATPSEARR